MRHMTSEPARVPNMMGNKATMSVASLMMLGRTRGSTLVRSLADTLPGQGAAQPGFDLSSN